jgi:putative spermidine/putrescine transport system ATP-binding protein
MLRPERIELSRGMQDGKSTMSGTVKDITFLGNNTHVLVESAGNPEVSVRLPFGNPALQGLTKGDTVLLQWKTEQAHAFCVG